MRKDLGENKMKQYFFVILGLVFLSLAFSCNNTPTNLPRSGNPTPPITFPLDGEAQREGQRKMEEKTFTRCDDSYYTKIVKNDWYQITQYKNPIVTVAGEMPSKAENLEDIKWKGEIILNADAVKTYTRGEGESKWKDYKSFYFFRATKRGASWDMEEATGEEKNFVKISDDCNQVKAAVEIAINSKIPVPNNLPFSAESFAEPLNNISLSEEEQQKLRYCKALFERLVTISNGSNEETKKKIKEDFSKNIGGLIWDFKAGRLTKIRYLEDVGATLDRIRINTGGGV
jgi:hypothetical protein